MLLPHTFRTWLLEVLCTIPSPQQPGNAHPGLLGRTQGDPGLNPRPGLTWVGSPWLGPGLCVRPTSFHSALWLLLCSRALCSPPALVLSHLPPWAGADPVSPHWSAIPLPLC